MPASRPRMPSGMVWFQTVLRNTPEIMSAAPREHEEDGDQPDARHQAGQRRRSAPYAAAAITIARPWWCTRAVQPLSAVATSAPTVSAE